MRSIETVDFFLSTAKSCCCSLTALVTHHNAELWLQTGVDVAGRGMYIRSQKNEKPLGQCSWIISQHMGKVHQAEYSELVPHFAHCGREDEWVTAQKNCSLLCKPENRVLS